MDEKQKHKILELYNFKFIQEVCKIALRDSRFFLLCGRTGIGKTTALRHFIDDNRAHTVRYIKIVENMTQKDFLRILGDHFNYDRAYMSSLTIINWIKLILNKTETKQLLIIDEGGKLNPKQYGVIHGLRDETMEKLGIVIASPEYLLEELDRWNKKRRKGIPEFFGRINSILQLEDLKPEEIVAICKSRGVNNNKIIQEKFIHLKDLRALRNALDMHLYYDKQFKNI